MSNCCSFFLHVTIVASFNAECSGFCNLGAAYFDIHHSLMRQPFAFWQMNMTNRFLGFAQQMVAKHDCSLACLEVHRKNYSRSYLSNLDANFSFAPSV